MNHPSASRKNRGRTQSEPSTAVVRWSTIFRWLSLSVAGLAVAAASWAFFEFVVLRKVPSELVGKWVVVGGPQDGATFDFARNGSLIGTVNNRGQEAHVVADVRVEGKNLYSTTLNPTTKIEETRLQVIRTLTAKDLVLEDERGGLLKMERAE